MGLLDLNYDVLVQIIAEFDKPTLRQFMVTNHTAYDLGLPILASSVILRTPLQLSSFCHFALSRAAKHIPRFLRTLDLSGSALKFPMDVGLLADLLTQATGLEEVLLWDSERMMFNDPRIRAAIASRTSMVRLVLGEGAGKLADAMLRSLTSPLSSLIIGRRMAPAPNFEMILPWRSTLRRLKLSDFAATSIPLQARWTQLTHLALFAPRVKRALLYVAFPNLRQLHLEDMAVVEDLHAQNTCDVRLAWPHLDAATVDLLSMYHYPLYSNVRRLEVTSFGSTALYHAQQDRLRESFFSGLAASGPMNLSMPILSEESEFWLRVAICAPRLEVLHLTLLVDTDMAILRTVLPCISGLPIKYFCLEFDCHHPVISIGAVQEHSAFCTFVADLIRPIERIELLWTRSGREISASSYRARRIPGRVRGSHEAVVELESEDMRRAMRRFYGIEHIVVVP
ncbi:hypothetical protein PUNSTDRAFT_52628 [Punctularia strigosozonata HHB-11173 SS5]|uniref:uncharacterized protein n=1 Tax=Punctularia strigosozonata (strain HHB-11173) TaxID=741275 RepID=UPI0004417045|nr:uncharacterized protein PUNSTDRAFT_52628 [Punctularia strigosozonata HHB-11173 SS5]EIN08138.1 hypothetical protein PUNSTDRAFT_52628 [Punctularia strigosozonata HHB-11173 SS5]